MRTMRAAWALLVSLLVLVAAGCGGEDIGMGEESGSELLRAGALVYWESASDPGSDQWNQAEDLIRRFPDGDEWIRQLRTSFERDTDVSWEEVKEALGDQAVVAVYATSPEDDPAVVGLTNPDDPNKTVEVVRKLNASDDGDDMVTRVVDDWVAISDKQTSIDAALKDEGAGSLADDDGFKAAMEELPDDSLSRVYFDAAEALEVFGAADPETRDLLRTLGLDRVDFAGAWAKAKDEGAELAFTLRGEGADRLLGTGDPYTSNLLERIPDDAFAFYSFRGDAAKEQLEQFDDHPLYSVGLRELERELGIELSELVTLFDGEVVFYARPGAPIPELTVLLDSEDPAEGRQSAERLLRSIAERAGGQVTEDGDITTALFEGFTVNLGSVEGAVVLTTAKGAFTDLAAEGDKLPDSDRFAEALDAAGAPEQYTGFAYVDLVEAVKLALGYGASAGEDIPEEVRRNLEPLRSLVVFGEEDGNLASSLVFVEIE
jgi:hypothetical protein